MKKSELNVIDTWMDNAGAECEVNVQDGWINASQIQYGQDVLAALAPEDARRYAAALIKAADAAESHPRWKDEEIS